MSPPALCSSCPMLLRSSPEPSSSSTADRTRQPTGATGSSPPAGRRRYKVRSLGRGGEVGLALLHDGVEPLGQVGAEEVDHLQCQRCFEDGLGVAHPVI